MCVLRALAACARWRGASLRRPDRLIRKNPTDCKPGSLCTNSLLPISENFETFQRQLCLRIVRAVSPYQRPRLAGGTRGQMGSFEKYNIIHTVTGQLVCGDAPTTPPPMTTTSAVAGHRNSVLADNMRCVSQLDSVSAKRVAACAGFHIVNVVLSLRISYN